jgi:hypothetical protein
MHAESERRREGSRGSKKKGLRKADEEARAFDAKYRELSLSGRRRRVRARRPSAGPRFTGSRRSCNYGSKIKDREGCSPSIHTHPPRHAEPRKSALRRLTRRQPLTPRTRQRRATTDTKRRREWRRLGSRR